ncbi:hypothetical protein [Ferrimonas balearica]|uniref:hypothetical protein n=1 Tax=Ferrimonas balearica TaxID=44012 RepID=UPI001C99FC9A|nr:hypothetical protein [Ferrimonas balearica]MBY5993141.1 hypothetical protein [Ferrimonas balearica]
MGGCLHGDSAVILDRQGAPVTLTGRDASTWRQLHKTLGPARLQWVLTDGHYQIHAVDRPKVSDDELAAALPFAVKDLVNLPMERIHLDYFQLAVQPAGSDKLQVVVTDRQQLATLAGAMDDAGFQPGIITIEELALLNLLPEHPRPQMLLWHLPGQPLKVLIGVGGQLLLSRQVRGFNQLDSLSATELDQGLFDALLLELQRSIDYLDRQLRQPAIAGVSLVLPLAQQALLQPTLEAQLGVPVEGLTTAERPPHNWLAHAAALERADEAER